MVKTHEFYCEVYPRRLWVSIGAGTEELKATFIPESISDMSENSDAEVISTGICDSERDVTGVLIRFRSKSVMEPDTIAHEAYHAMMEIFHDIGAADNMYESQEPAAYFVGWIVKCIYEAKNYKPNK